MVYIGLVSGINNISRKLIIQWGQSVASGWRDVNFPTSYSGGNPVITVTINDTSQTFYNLGVHSVTNNKFQIKISISNQQKSVFWMSIGY